MWEASYFHLMLFGGIDSLRVGERLIIDLGTLTSRDLSADEP